MKNWRGWAAGLLVCAAAAWAVDWTAYKPQGYVSDFANVIDPASRSQLENYCAAVERATHAQIALVTVPSLEGEPIEDVAYELARAWGVGRKGQNDGILLLLAIQDRRSRLEVGSGLEPVLPDSLTGNVLSEMRPALRRGQYGEALMAAAETIGQTVAKARHVKIDATLPRKTRPETGTGCRGRCWWVAGCCLSGCCFPARRAGMAAGAAADILPWLILGNMMGRSSWGSRSSGGFGGYDSGDSFGGFGGGDFGGGGASSDW